MAFLQENKFDEAIAHFRHAVELSGDWDVPMNSLALLIAAAWGYVEPPSIELKRRFDHVIGTLVNVIYCKAA